MCAPEHFEVVYEINPWMHVDVPVDRERARAQWDALVAALRSAGADVELLEPHPGLPDLVFTANAGLVSGRRFVAARFRNAERRDETPHATGWFEQNGWRVEHLPTGLHQEGAGDALPFGPPGDEVLVTAHRFRSDRAGNLEVGRRLGVPVHSLELVDPRLYHLDLGFCPLDERRALVTPAAFTPPARRVLEEIVPEPLVLELDEALTFCANSVVVSRTVVMPACPARVGRQLEAWGFDVAVVPLTEFRKAGGACRCLTLALDMALGAASRPLAA